MSAALAGKRVAIYARYSSALQNERSIEDQVQRCVEYVESSGAAVDDQLVFTDMAVSAASLQRPGFEQMMRAVSERRVDAIVAEDISRISRDLADSAALFKRLQYAGVPLIGVADGINTGEKTAKLTFTVKSLVADLYLDDLRDKTRRGLEGRCRAGFSTGGLPFGYRSEPAFGANGRELGRRVVVDQEAAAIVRRVFTLYLDGHSFDGIAKTFNAEGVPYARLGKGFRRRGWVAGSVRAILHNRAYVGEWTYNRREWRKEPGTNVRRPKHRAENEVITQVFPDRRIVSAELWDRVRARAAAVAARYGGKRERPVAPGSKTNYVLSGLLFCGLCSAAMTITAGTSARYYSCGDMRKRGTCTNKAMVREDAVREAVLGALREALFTPQAISFLRKRIVDGIRATTESAARDEAVLAERIRRTEERIRGLVTFVADGDHSQYVRDALRDLEAQAGIDRGALQTLRDTHKSPVKLPSPEFLIERARELERLILADPLRGREALRGVLREGKIVMRPQGDSAYLAEFDFLALVAVGGGSSTDPQSVATRLSVLVPKPVDRRRKR